MSPLVPLVMFGWIPAVLLLFAFLPPRRAAATAFVVAWLFLPVVSYSIPGMPDYSKMSATCVGVLLASLLFNAGAFLRLRPHWLDVPMMVWCLVPLATSLSNGLGAWDGMSGVLRQTVAWGMPYLIGRIYFNSLSAHADLARAILLGGLIYIPLCLIEIRMSPQLHNWLYGFVPSWGNVQRYGGWRPVVFMQDGLAVGMWMTTAAIVALGLARAGALPQVMRLPKGLLVPLLIGTAVLCKSIGALLLLAIGAVLISLRHRWLSMSIGLLALAPAAYVGFRMSGSWSGASLVEMTASFDAERADSLATRIRNEDLLVGHALAQPVWGWGTWGRNFVYDEETERYTGIPDGLWVIAIGVNGVVGLSALLLLQALPVIGFLRMHPASLWRHPAVAPAAALTIVLALSAVDNLMNAMLNPIYMLIAGGLTSVVIAARARHPSTVISTSRGGLTPPAALPARVRIASGP